MPITIPEQEVEAREAVEAGATIIHAHVRNTPMKRLHRSRKICGSQSEPGKTLPVL
ncbi:MAG: 3-keto-5-aminohexanoate cleavage protein [Ahrensia sp.]|nr:3-keto-5-aminohexanoate cleavage protein [Ahrensia sp.]